MKTKSVEECYIQREFTLFQPHFDFLFLSKKKKKIYIFFYHRMVSFKRRKDKKKKKGAAGYFFIKTKIINKYTGLFNFIYFWKVICKIKHFTVKISVAQNMVTFILYEKWTST